MVNAGATGNAVVTAPAAVRASVRATVNAAVRASVQATVNAAVADNARVMVNVEAGASARGLANGGVMVKGEAMARSREADRLQKRVQPQKTPEQSRSGIERGPAEPFSGARNRQCAHCPPKYCGSQLP